MDDELFSRLQHRRKQGLYLRVAAFNGITPNQIGNESLLRRITKQTAMCVTRLIYRYPQLAKQIDPINLLKSKKNIPNLYPRIGKLTLLYPIKLSRFAHFVIITPMT